MIRTKNYRLTQAKLSLTKLKLGLGIFHRIRLEIDWANSPAPWACTGFNYEDNNGKHLSNK